MSDEEIYSLVRGDKGFIETYLLRIKRFLEQPLGHQENNEKEFTREERTKT